MNRPNDRYLRFPRVGLRRFSGNGLSGCGHAIPPTGGRKLTASEYQSQMVPFALELANRICAASRTSQLADLIRDRGHRTRVAHICSRTSLAIRSDHRKHRSLCDEESCGRLPRVSSVDRIGNEAIHHLVMWSTRFRRWSKGPIASPRNSTGASPPPMALVVARRKPRDAFRDVELADAVEHQINTLPRRYRRIARLLRTHNQNEIANKLGLSKRKSFAGFSRDS